MSDTASTILQLLAKELTRRLTEDASSMSAAELEVVRKISSDAGITLASIRKGVYGDGVAELAASIEIDLPFDIDDQPRAN